jgi:3-methyladenine DNA glycosylase AlkD
MAPTLKMHAAKKSRRGGTPTPEVMAASILARLEAEGDPVQAAGAKRYFKEAVEFYGLTTPKLRALADEFHARIMDSWALGDMTALCEILLPEKKYEAKVSAIILLLKFKKDFTPALVPRLKRWLAADYCNNWACVDVLCPEALSWLIERRPGLIGEIKTWTGHPNRWVRRASIVAFVPLARHGKFLDEAYDVALRIFPVRDDLLEKANGWMLREAGKKDSARLEAFLLRHGPAIPRTTVRYAIERFPEAKRKKLLLNTKGESER